MNHQEALNLLAPYQDGELDLAGCLKLEEHLAGCEECNRKLAEEKELIELIDSKAARFKPSPFFKTRLHAALNEIENSPATPPWWKQFLPMRTYSGWIVAAAVLTITASVTFRAPENSDLAQAAISNHVRSLQADHLVDVVSSDQHTVKPWFAGKLDYSPQVVDLGPAGYPVIGGRLDVLDHRTVAAIVYQRRKHYINLFVWPASGKNEKRADYARDGYNVLEWTKAGMHYLAVSELGEKELREFGEMILAQTLDPSSAGVQ